MPIETMVNIRFTLIIPTSSAELQSPRIKGPKSC